MIEPPANSVQVSREQPLLVRVDFNLDTANPQTAGLRFDPPRIIQAMTINGGGWAERGVATNVKDGVLSAGDWHARQLAKQIGLTPDEAAWVLSEAIDVVREDIKLELDILTNDKSKPPRSITYDEVGARAFLSQHRSFIGRYLYACGEIGIVGDKQTLTADLLVGQSSAGGGEDSLNIQHSGSTSGWKSHASRGASYFFPPEVVCDVGSLSVKALIYNFAQVNPDNPNEFMVQVAPGFIFTILEAPPDEVMEFLRPVMSGDRKEVPHLTVLDIGGEKKGVKMGWKGKPSFVVACPGEYLSDEIRNRMINAPIDERSEKVSKVVEAQSQADSIERDIEPPEWVAQLKNALAYIYANPLPTINPHLPAIGEGVPKDKVETMRYNRYLRRMMEVAANLDRDLLLHTADGRTITIVMQKHVQFALFAFRGTMPLWFTGVGKRALDLFELILNTGKEDRYKRELINLWRKNVSSTGIGSSNFDDLVKSLENGGYIVRTTSDGQIIHGKDSYRGRKVYLDPLDDYPKDGKAELRFEAPREGKIYKLLVSVLKKYGGYYAYRGKEVNPRCAATLCGIEPGKSGNYSKTVLKERKKGRREAKKAKKQSGTAENGKTLKENGNSVQDSIIDNKVKPNHFSESSHGENAKIASDDGGTEKFPEIPGGGGVYTPPASEQNISDALEAWRVKNWRDDYPPTEQIWYDGVYNDPEHKILENTHEDSILRLARIKLLNAGRKINTPIEAVEAAQREIELKIANWNSTTQGEIKAHSIAKIVQPNHPELLLQQLHGLAKLIIVGGGSDE